MRLPAVATKFDREQDLLTADFGGAGNNVGVENEVFGGHDLVVQLNFDILVILGDHIAEQVVGPERREAEADQRRTAFRDSPMVLAVGIDRHVDQKAGLNVMFIFLDQPHATRQCGLAAVLALSMAARRTGLENMS